MCEGVKQKQLQKEQLHLRTFKTPIFLIKFQHIPTTLLFLYDHNLVLLMLN